MSNLSFMLFTYEYHLNSIRDFRDTILVVFFCHSILESVVVCSMKQNGDGLSESKIIVHRNRADEFQKKFGSSGNTTPIPQGTQRKRPHNQVQSHVMASQASDIATSSPIEVGSASQEAAHKPLYEQYTEITEAQLFEWLEVPGNYEMWKGAWIRNASGATQTSGLTKKA